MSERRVKLTPEQLKEVRRAGNDIGSLRKTLNIVIEQIADKVSERELDMWDQIHQICGTTVMTHDLTLEFITGEVVVTERSKENQ